MALTARLPAIAIPLRATDEDITLDLQQPLDRVYSRGRYDTRIDYNLPPEPLLSPDDAAWGGAADCRMERVFPEDGASRHAADQFVFQPRIIRIDLHVADLLPPPGVGDVYLPIRLSGSPPGRTAPARRCLR